MTLQKLLDYWLYLALGLLLLGGVLDAVRRRNVLYGVAVTLLVGLAFMASGVYNR
ncbi:hypothetical protein [Cupriavidus sp. TMH.W2]|uniref:hypothetical protein n=1 Tax=Cupriavidus sp. TMH.W2 TaxID=3434465 RepID=UPI003D771DC4